MKILIDDIPEEGLNLRATEADPWLASLARDVFGDAFLGSDHVSLSVDLNLIEDNVTLTGVVTGTFHPTCDRCLAIYETQVRVPLKTVLSPLYEGKKRKRRNDEHESEEIMAGDDLGFSYYTGDSFNLGVIVREQMVLAEPMIYICKEGCKGLCQYCGKNLNDGPCDCKEEPRLKLLDALKKGRH